VWPCGLTQKWWWLDSILHLPLSRHFLCSLVKCSLQWEDYYNHPIIKVYPIGILWLLKEVLPLMYPDQYLSHRKAPWTEARVMVMAGQKFIQYQVPRYFQIWNCVHRSHSDWWKLGYSWVFAAWAGLGAVLACEGDKGMAFPWGSSIPHIGHHMQTLIFVEGWWLWKCPPDFE
jgi:hypothetical protein